LYLYSGEIRWDFFASRLLQIVALLFSAAGMKQIPIPG
jgi:hypothetical protein